jgi:hypothetical protein
MQRRAFLQSLTAAALTAMAPPLRAQTLASPLDLALTPTLLAALQGGGHNIFFRHGITLREDAPDEGNADTPRSGDCALERNLSQLGIDQMRGVGAAFDLLRIPFGIVRASPTCRCVDSAWWAFGRVERDRNLLLNGDTPEGDASQARPWAAIRTMGAVPPLPLTNSVFVTHSRVGEIFGSEVVMEGEAVIVRPDGVGGWTLLAHIKADQWVQP